MESPISEGEECTITVTSLSAEGEGIGAFQGLKIFVEGILPGEEAQIRITDLKKNYAKGHLLSLLKTSPERTEPICPVFTECGGCQIMHIHYPAQLKLKQKKVKDALQRIGGFLHCEPLPCSPSPLSLGYRNKILLPVVWDHGKKIMGLYRKQSHEVIPIKKCLIQCPQGEEILSLISEKLTVPTVRHVLIRNAVFRGEALVVFVTNGEMNKELKTVAQELMKLHSTIKGVVENLNPRNDNVILGSTFRLLAGRPFIYEQLLGKTFKISPSAFFQVNPGQAEKFYQRAIELAQLEEKEIVVDAYCGVGALAILAAPHVAHAYGIETIPHAVADAIENARLNRLSNCTFICGKAEEELHLIKKIDVVFLNPPRKGCQPPLLNTLLKKKPRKIIYISCDPATLARDLSRLSPTYQIEIVHPFDMFPQTMHVETVVRLSIRPLA